MTASTTTTASATNQEHADRLLAEAVTAARRRRALLCAAVALGSTRSLPAARQALADWDAPVEVRQDATGILDAISRSTP